MVRRFRVGLCQMVSQLEGVETNFSTLEGLLGRASKANCQLAVLPENLLTFGLKARFTRDEQVQWLVRFSALARAHKLWLVAGSMPLHGFSWADGDGDGDWEVSADTIRWHDASEDVKPFATCVVFDDQGRIASAYRKMHLFDADVKDNMGAYRESDSFSRGDMPVVCETPWGRMGVGICYDLRFPEYFRALRQQGADFVVLPSAFTWATGKVHWELLLRARAVENQIVMIGVNQGGEHTPQRKTWGDSMVVNGWGEIIARAGDDKLLEDSQLGEHLVVTQVDLDELELLRKDMPVWNHRRLQ